VDIVKVMVDASHKRKREAFWEYRINGADRTEDNNTPKQLPMKEQHPDWLVQRGLVETRLLELRRARGTGL